MKSFSHVRLFVTPWTVAHQAPLSMRFSRQEYWTGLPFSSPGDLPDPGIEPKCPTLQAEALTSEPPGKPKPPSCPLTAHKNLFPFNIESLGLNFPTLFQIILFHWDELQTLCAYSLLSFLSRAYKAICLSSRDIPPPWVGCWVGTAALGLLGLSLSVESLSCEQTEMNVIPQSVIGSLVE